MSEDSAGPQQLLFLLIHAVNGEAVTDLKSLDLNIVTRQGETLYHCDIGDILNMASCI